MSRNVTIWCADNKSARVVNDFLEDSSFVDLLIRQALKPESNNTLIILRLRERSIVSTFLLVPYRPN